MGKGAGGHFDLRGNVIEWLNDSKSHKRKRRITIHKIDPRKYSQRKALDRRTWIGFRLAFEKK